LEQKIAMSPHSVRIACLLCLGLILKVVAAAPAVSLSADFTKTRHVLRGGIGASWHAMETPIPVVGDRSHGGSGWGGNHPGPSTWPAAIKDAELVVRALNVGAEGFNRWSFVNRGDLDGQWQLVDTWDPATQNLLRTQPSPPGSSPVRRRSVTPCPRCP
jgi:hypothetical protein